MPHFQLVNILKISLRLKNLINKKSLPYSCILRITAPLNAVQYKTINYHYPFNISLLFPRCNSPSTILITENQFDFLRRLVSCV